MNRKSLQNIVAISIVPVNEGSTTKAFDERWKTAEVERALIDANRRWRRRYKFRWN